MAINALARIYQWERYDQPQRSLFINEAGPDSEILTLSEIRPELLTCYRVPVPSGIPDRKAEAVQVESLPLLRHRRCRKVRVRRMMTGLMTRMVMTMLWRCPGCPQGKENPHIHRFVSIFNGIAPHESRWQVFSDFVHMAACSLYNAVHRDPDFEADYMRRVSHYSAEDANNMARLLSEVVMGLEFSPTDFWGEFI